MTTAGNTQTTTPTSNAQLCVDHPATRTECDAMATNPPTLPGNTTRRKNLSHTGLLGLLCVLGCAAGPLAIGGVTAATVASATTTTAAVSRAAPISITMAAHTLTLSTHTAPHGVISFVLANPTTVAHEIDIVKTLLAPGALPTKTNGQFNEHTTQARVVKEAVKIKPGATRTFTARLAAGHYVVVDNLPGHYHDGEASDLTIT